MWQHVKYLIFFHIGWDDMTIDNYYSNFMPHVSTCGTDVSLLSFSGVDCVA